MLETNALIVEEWQRISAEAKSVLFALMDALNRTQSESVPNPQGTQIRCRLCRGHYGGALGWSHNEHCYAGDAVKRASALMQKIKHLDLYV